MITSSIMSNNLHVKQIESIEVNHVAQVPLQAIWLGRQRQKVYSPWHLAYRDNMGGSDTDKSIRTIASMVQGLHRRLMFLLGHHQTSSLMYWPCCNHLNQGQKPINARFGIHINAKTLQLCRNASSIWLKVATRSHPHLETHCIISWWLMLSPPCGPGATNRMNCLLVSLKSPHWNCDHVVPNVFCTLKMTDILIIIDVVCAVCKSLDTPSNVIL